MTVQNYFKHFDDTFKTDISNNIDINKLPMINIAFEHLGELIHNPSNDKKEISHILLKQQEKLLQTFNEEQKALFEEYERIEGISTTELARQMLAFGYSIAYQELKEMNALK